MSYLTYGQLYLEPTGNVLNENISLEPQSTGRNYIVKSSEHRRTTRQQQNCLMVTERKPSNYWEPRYAGDHDWTHSTSSPEEDGQQQVHATLVSYKHETKDPIHTSLPQKRTNIGKTLPRSMSWFLQQHLDVRVSFWYKKGSIPPCINILGAAGDVMVREMFIFLNFCDSSGLYLQ